MTASRPHIGHRGVDLGLHGSSASALSVRYPALLWMHAASSLHPENGESYSGQQGRAVVGPTEVAVLVKMYNAVLAEPWFTTDDVKRNRFLRYVIEAFRAGINETDQLTTHWSRRVGSAPFLETPQDARDSG